MGYVRAPTEKLTYEAFLDWLDEDTWAEWVDGEVILLTPASLRHQEVSGFLHAVLSAFVEEHGLGTVVGAPFQMKTGPDLPGREPDLLFVAQERRERLKGTHLDGPADLVVEVASPESRLRDRGEKFAEYELGGVKEYWIVDPDEARADFFVLGEDGRYERVRPDARGVYRSRVLQGFWLNADWLWQQPLPRMVDVLRQLGLV